VGAVMPGPRTRIGCVIGWPVEHSKSPALHNAAFAAAGIDAVFVALPVHPDHLAAAVAGMKAMGFLGCSVTVPHKEAVLALCDRVTEPAASIGAVNCLSFEDNAVIGHNTDAGGFVDSLRDASIDPKGRRAILLGAGGAARAIAAGLREAGATVDVIARSPDKYTWTEARPWTAETLADLAPRCHLLVDCTSAALDPASESNLPAPIPIEALPAGAAVASLVYHREPALLAHARQRGLHTIDGAGMLLHQGARALRLWLGIEPPVTAMRATFHV
jgi:shikimate dehydrogenase